MILALPLLFEDLTNLLVYESCFYFYSYLSFDSDSVYTDAMEARQK